MKRCPECRRDYTDETLNFCLDDGARLLDGPASGDEPATEILRDFGRSQTRFPSEAQPGIKTTLTGKRIAIGTVVVLIVVGITFGLVQFWGRNAKPEPTEPVKMTRLTSSGKVTRAVISPDGKFLAYVESEGEKQSLWTKQIVTNSNIQIVAPSQTDYFDVTFSADGNYVYFLVQPANEKASSLYRVPTLGGTAVKVFNNKVNEAISFSPDGSRVAFERYDVGTTESSLIVANADGTNEQRVSSLTEHEWFSTRGPAWSPDGKSIAIGAGDDRNERQMTLVAVNLSEKTLKPLTNKRWDSIGRAIWLGDGSGILFSASENGTNAPRQIWHVAYPDGTARRVTQDLNSYLDVSVTADASAFVATQTDLTSGIWIAPNADIAKAQQIAGGRDDGAGGIAWTPDGRIVFISSDSGATEVWIMNQQGGGRRQLTNDGAVKFSPAVSPDGRYIVFVSELTGAKLWSTDLDGSHLRQITNGNYDGTPRISPDSQWVIYSTYNSGKLTLWKVPIEGGASVRLTDMNSTEPDVSPDGKLAACFHNDAQFSAKLLILPLDGGGKQTLFDLPQNLYWSGGPRWTPDGRTLTYIEKRGNSSNLWGQPVSGGPAKILAEFKENGMLYREWSPGGKQVAIVRGTTRTDVVMVRNFR